MAFPIPSHLPRKRDNDVSTKLLTKMSEVTTKALTFELASSWVSELDTTIRDTKQRIHDRVEADLPAFERQFSSAKLIQERLQTLRGNVDGLDKALSDPESGMVSNLIMTLTKHASLSQDVLDCDVNYQALEYLCKCRKGLEALSTLEKSGRLPEAVEACDKLEEMLKRIPHPLESSKVMADFKRRYRSVKDRTQEQLNEAYSRSIIILPTEIIIRPAVQVRQSDTVLPLSDILSSLSSVSLDSHISVLRRDLSTHYVDYVLKQPASVTTVTNNAGLMNAEHKLTVFRAPPSDEVLSTRIENIITVLTFLDKHLFPHLPSHLGFSLSLCKPLTAALLDRLLIPSLPSSVDQLPQFLTLVKQAVEFEQTYIGELLGEDMAEKKVKSWADAVGSHYERRRRVDFLERARTIILRPINDKESFVVEIISMGETKEPPQATTPIALYPPPSKPPPIAEEGVWNFEDEDSADEWGLDDDVEREPETQVTPLEVAPEPHPEPEEEEPDDPWGWNDDNASPVGDGDTSTDSSAWDDPWDGPAITVEAKPAKAATKLEKYSSGKGKSTNGTQVLQSPTPLVAPPTTPAMPPSMKEQPVIANAPQSTIVKETYAVSSKMKEIMSLVQDVLLEASDLSSSGILSPFEPNTSQIGDIISQAASLSLDLYRAIYPVTFATKLEASPKQSLGFSNDCLWLSEEILTVVADSGARGATEIKLEESATRIKVLGESWFEEAIDRKCQQLNSILDDAGGFARTNEQERFDECEEAVHSLLQDVRQFARQLKPVLTKSKYYTAVGSVINAALSRILRDVLALPDITAVESQKLSELCRILNALEGLFVEDTEQSSFVVAYVPNWLKFSYLSELMEASIADISYLFEEGDLVDFEIDELVKLVRALFADTPLRTNTINKLMRGHPLPSS